MDEIELNGVKYIRKDLAEKRIKDSKILKQEIDTIFAEAEAKITKLIENDKNFTEKVMQEPNTIRLSKKQIESLLMPSSLRLYSDVCINEDGSIRLGNQTATYTMDSIDEIKNEIEAGTLTKNRITDYKKKLSVPIQQMHRIIYNILHGMFNGQVNHSTKKYKTFSDIFDPSSYVNAMKTYHIHTMEPTGKLCATGGNFDLSIQQVLQIQLKVCTKDITVGRAKQVAKDMNISYPTLCRVAWNIDKGYFDAFIREWKARLNNFVDDTVFDWGKKTVPVENNPQKRKDNGYYISQ